MTCGVCSPEAFQPANGKRVWGYLTASDMHVATAQARKLYFMGAQRVLSDKPGDALEDRSGWHMLDDPVMLRKGDRLILSKVEDLGTDTDQAEAHIEALALRGVEVCILKPEYFEEEGP